MTKLRYIWLDAKGHIRNKLKIVDGHISKVSDVEQWSYDGSSTGQANTVDSDLFLNPVRIYQVGDTLQSANRYETIVLCDVTDFDGKPVGSNKRPQLVELAEKYSSNIWLFENACMHCKCYLLFLDV